MLATMEFIPVGTLVRYNGSIESMRGEYTVVAHSDLDSSPYYQQPEIREHYPNDEAYDIWPVGVPVKYGNRGQAIFFVRRQSITVVE